MTQFSVTVVIQAGEPWHGVKSCLENIRPTLGINDQVVLVGPDNSDLKQFPWVKHVEAQQDLPYSKAANLGAKDCETDIIVFLNFCLTPTSKWLDGLTDAFNDTSVAAAGPRSNGAVGAQRVVTANYPTEGMSAFRQWSKQWRQEHRGQLLETLSLDYLCFAIRRADFELVGGFDENSTSGKEAITELCKTLNHQDKKLMITQEVYLHFGKPQKSVAHSGQARFKVQTDVQAQKGDNKLISACMIVKDEVHVLEECLDSLSGVVDEVVIYDTGSTDGTIELARAAGARVIEGYWDDDFSRARNAALEQCNGTWIFWIDADEKFEGDPLQLRNWLLDYPNPDGLSVEILNLNDNEKQHFVHHACRLFRKERMQWKGRLHEQPFPRNEEETPLIVELYSNIGKLIHSGYLSSTVKTKNKGDRNVRIAAMELDDEHGDMVEKLTNLGRSLSLADQNDEALVLFNKARDHYTTPSPAVWRQLLRSGAQMCIALDQFDEATSWLNDLSEASQNQSTTRFHRGHLYLKMGEWDKAIEQLADLKDELDDDGMTFPVFLAKFRLAIAYASSGKWEKSADVISEIATQDSHGEQIWALALEVYWRAEKDLKELFSRLSPRHINDVFAQLTMAHPQAANVALEILHEDPVLRSNVIALAIRVAPRMEIEDTLKWAARIRATGLSEHCPLVAVFWDITRPAEDRIRAAAIASASFAEAKAITAVKLTSADLDINKFADVIYELHEIAPNFLEPFVIAACTDPARSFAMGQALYQLGADDEGIAVLLNGIESGADTDLMEKACQWLDSVGQTQVADEVRSKY